MCGPAASLSVSCEFWNKPPTVPALIALSDGSVWVVLALVGHAFYCIVL